MRFASKLLGGASKLSDGASKFFFGSDKAINHELLSEEQKRLRNSLIGDIGQYTGGSIDALGGYSQEGYNPYDELAGDEVVERLKDKLFIENERNKRSFANSNIGKRFSYARSAGENQMNQDFSNKLADLDYQNLMAKTGFRQQGYGNQMQAIQGIMGNAQNLMTPTSQMLQTHNPGALDYLGGITSGIKSITGMFK